MFKITPVKPEDIKFMEEYLNPEKNCIILACYEPEGITGGVSFEIEGGDAFLDKLRADELIMEEILLKSAMNFLEVHGIYNLYLKEETDLYHRLDFKESDKQGYKMQVNIDGYFDTHKCHG